MRIEGKLTRWNDERGFGFITPTQGGQDIFVHISAFPRDGRRPAVGEAVVFEIEVDGSGRKRARNLQCSQRPVAGRKSQLRRPAAHRRQEKPGLLWRLIPLLLIVGLGAYGYDAWTSRGSSSPVGVVAPDVQGAVSPYRCDGRTHCSQMTSCAEATFFLRNCPNTQMDGNGDGVPCERQWCTSPFAK